MTVQYITVSTREMPLTIPAVVSGYLAIHRTLTVGDLYAKTWTVTEIKSGRKLCITVECFGARLAMRLLSTINFARMDEYHPEFIQTYTEAMYILIARDISLVFPTIAMIEHLKNRLAD